MKERSVYEGILDRSGMICTGTVVGVDAGGRRVRVKTMGTGVVDDLDVYDARVVHQAWHVEGDEDVAIPRNGSVGIVSFIGTEAFWLGAYPLDMTTGDSQRDNQLVLNPGDRVLKTSYGSYVVIRTSGLIEMHSAPL